MVANIDVFGSWAELWKASKFKCIGVVLKHFAVYNGLSAYDLEILASNFIQQFHNRNDIS